jgi:hypothetical protein
MLSIDQWQAKTSFERADLCERFRRLLEEFCNQAQRDGLNLTPYFSDEPMAPFKRLPIELQRLVYANFERYYRIFSANSADGNRVNDDRAVVWKLVREMDLRPCSDLLDRIEDNDVIEAYDHTFIQVFRNARFLELCTYPVDHIFSCEFHQLFKRPDEITNRLIELGTSLFRGGFSETIPTEMPEHVLEEIRSTRRRKFLIRQGIISPLFDRSKRPVMGIATLKAEVLSQESALPSSGRSLF